MTGRSERQEGSVNRTMKKMLFIYNPRSGKGQIRGSLSAIIECFSANDYDVTIRATQGVKDGERIAEERAGEFDLVVCSGGDGTLDEIVTGMMRSGVRKPIGYIPAGSTNDFANSLGIPKSMEQAAEAAAKGAPFACDLGRFNDDYFVYVAAFGIFTDVSYQTSQELKNMLGHAAYLLEGMKRMGTWKSSHLTVESEEYSAEGDFVFGMITNSNSVGGIKGISGHNVELNDGLFEVLLVHTPQNLIEWQETITAVLTKDTQSRRIEMFKTRKMRILSEEPMAWTRDGENGGEHTCVEVENLQERLDILVEEEPEASQGSIVQI